jgi:hypothetical protein
MNKQAQAVWGAVLKLWDWYRRRGVLTLSIVNALGILLGCVFLAAFWLGGEPPSVQAMSRWGASGPGGGAGAAPRAAGAEARSQAPAAARNAQAVRSGTAIGRREYQVKLRAPRQGAVPARGAAPPGEPQEAVRLEGAGDEQPTLMRE